MSHNEWSCGDVTHSSPFAGSGSYQFVSTERSVHGEYSLKIIHNDSGYWANIYKEVPAGNYIFKGKSLIKYSTKVIAKIRNGDSLNELTLSQNTEFTDFSLSLTVPEDTEIQIQMFCYGDNTAITYWDDLQLIKSS